eukprot:4617664-Alexandrium_andersonii.AAC.1
MQHMLMSAAQNATPRTVVPQTGRRRVAPHNGKKARTFTQSSGHPRRLDRANHVSLSSLSQPEGGPSYPLDAAPPAASVAFPLRLSHPRRSWPGEEACDRGARTLPTA